MITKIEKAVRKAGEHLLKGFNGAKEVNKKGKIDLVTQYDVEVEKILLEELSFMSSDYGFLAEETAKGRADKKNIVYIDPIDGTTNFVHGFPFCCISVGVYEAGEGTCGVVYNPVMNELYTAEKGCGAFMNGERIKVSKTNTINEALIATGFPYTIADGDERDYMSILLEILRNTRGIRRAGSAALDLCYVAKGVFDAYYEFNLKPWDVAAGCVIASEAGAIVRDYHIDRQIDIHDNFIMASNLSIFSRIREIILNDK